MKTRKDRDREKKRKVNLSDDAMKLLYNLKSDESQKIYRYIYLKKRKRYKSRINNF